MGLEPKIVDFRSRQLARPGLPFLATRLENEIIRDRNEIELRLTLVVLLILRFYGPVKVRLRANGGSPKVLGGTTRSSVLDPKRMALAAMI